MKESHPSFALILPASFQKGKVAWRSPSNIAFIKYWGKYGVQYPKNASLSMSLSKSSTETSIEYSRAGAHAKRAFLFEGKAQEAFAQRIWKFIDSLSEIYPFLNQLNLSISSRNSFPHSAGIASSASAMSALALALVDMERKLFGRPASEDDFYRKASHIARLGSGSAARSVYGAYSIWGENLELQKDSSNDFALPLQEEVADCFLELHDSILIIDQGQKEVSSSLGHSLMNGHPYAGDRLKQAKLHLKSLLSAMKAGDQDLFVKIVESEALSLHALMMSSDPWFILMKADTLQVLQKIKRYRESTGHFICFTLDAGPNVHVLYGKQDKIAIEEFIDKDLKPYCYEGHIIFDHLGKGPQKID